jgi:hypothetical protein
LPITLYDSDSGDINMILTGKVMITRPVSMFKEPRFLSLVELLRSGDITFTNIEVLFHNYESPPFRRSTRSATVPPHGPRRRRGMPLDARTSPREVGEPVSFRTSERMEVCCKKVPLADTTCPTK